MRPDQPVYVWEICNFDQLAEMSQDVVLYPNTDLSPGKLGAAQDLPEGDEPAAGTRVDRVGEPPARFGRVEPANAATERVDFARRAGLRLHSGSVRVNQSLSLHDRGLQCRTSRRRHHRNCYYQPTHCAHNNRSHQTESRRWSTITLQFNAQAVVQYRYGLLRAAHRRAVTAGSYPDAVCWSSGTAS